MPERYKEIIKKELEMMIGARIIKRASSPWRFPVVIAQRKHESVRFCVDCCALNKRMKTDRVPSSKIEEVFDDLKGYNVFSKLDIFTGP